MFNSILDSIGFINTIIALLVIVVFYVYNKLKFWTRHGIINVPSHMIQIAKNPLHVADHECIQKYGKIVGFYEFLNPCLLITEPKLINKILIENFKDIPGHRIWATEDVHGGKSIFMVDGERWKLMRGMISPAFTSKNLKLMQDIVKESSQTLINHLDLISTKGKPFDIRPYLESYVMDVVLRAIFGTKVDSAGDPNNPIVAHSKEIFKVDFSLSRLIAVFAPNFAKLFGLTPLDKRASIFMTELSLRIITERRKHNVKRNDFIQYLISGNMNESEIKTIDDKKLYGLTDGEIIDNCLIYFIGGFDTTSSALANAAYCLATNPAEQEKLIEEIDQVLGEDGEISIDATSKMNFLDACVKETLRLWPSVVRVERRSLCDFKLDQLTIPKGSYAFIPVYAVHRDPQNYEDPDSFKPERFMPENKSKIKPATFIPFADGPRNCLGYKFALIMLKLSLVYILRKYTIVACDKTNDLKFYSGTIMLTRKDLIIKLENRF